jgi:hypothetical protein
MLIVEHFSVATLLEQELNVEPSRPHVETLSTQAIGRRIYDV